MFDHSSEGPTTSAVCDTLTPAEGHQLAANNDKTREIASNHAPLVGGAAATTDETTPGHVAQAHDYRYYMAENRIPELLTSNKDELEKCTLSYSSATANEHWDSAVANFLREAGLTQALRGFESDMIILNPEWERSKIPQALSRLVMSLQRPTADFHDKGLPDVPTENIEPPLDGRKLKYVHFAGGVEARTPSTVTNSISRFLAQNRARNDASNRHEFLLSSSEKRRRLNESGEFEGVVASCARTDAKMQNRDLQMKYDVAKNEDGPLRKTVASKTGESKSSARAKETASGGQGQLPYNEGDATIERYPGLDERLRNIEAHVAIRYVPSPPRLLTDRLKFIEDHLVQLETEYPPWAALHFNQPRRGWPPPPRPTPIIVPSHLTSAAAQPHSLAPHADNHPFDPSAPVDATPGNPALSAKAKGKQAVRTAQSSLHRAVMERLEVQKAMNDLAGNDQ